MSDTVAAPIAFRPEFEQPAPDEPETSAAMRAAMRHIVEVTSRDYGQAVRAVHAKSHGLLEGMVEVLDGSPPFYAQDVFATPGTYPACCGSPPTRATSSTTACRRRADSR